MLKYVLIILATLSLLTLAVMGVRGMTSRRPPLMVFDDMDDMPKYKNQAGSEFFPDGRQMRPIPPGTVAWGRDAGRPDSSVLYSDAGAFQTKRIPMAIDAPLLQRGQKLFTVNCAVCHGGFGDGNGITVKYGQAPPANYHTDRLLQVTDGYIYQVITEGKGLMGPYGPNIKPADRWAIVAYVRALQRAGDATIDDVPAALRAELISSRQQSTTGPATTQAAGGSATQATTGAATQSSTTRSGTQAVVKQPATQTQARPGTQPQGK